MANLFRKQAQSYATARPTYPLELFRYIASKCPGRRLAWDAGTGSGQAAASLSAGPGRGNAAASLSSIFDSVIATDVSPEQLSHTPSQIPNIRFILTPPFLPLADLHRLVAPPASIDLITVAQALHWFDLPTFFAQARSMLSPGGVLAAWCYTRAVIDDGRSRADEIYREIYAESGPYWAEERKMVEEGYVGVEFPFRAVEGEEGTGPVVRFATEREMTAADFLEYVRSWSAYQTAREKGVELLTDEVKEELGRARGDDGEETKLVRFPISLRIGRI
ncbi:putative methyltransferase DDB_G0268948 [Phalaenopsis equestris]|uniref:putative methyltransferase DDB_G0268948 n=1 Tax=Phalaenopsis equestris TaxID=78828 RepID=UPI0009E49A60|nr:putative methyltransferase DDB_G0268948 [Phalaenopsis equestris]